MHAHPEGFRRLTWVMSGALLCAWALHVYNQRDDLYFSDAATWIQISIGAIASVFLPHIAYRAFKWVRAGFFGISGGHLKELNDPRNLKDQVVRNMDVVDRMTDEIASRIAKSGPNPETNHGQMHDVLANVLKPLVGEYALALVQICRFRHNKDFFSSEENHRTKQIFIFKNVSKTTAFLESATSKADQQLMIRMASKDVEEVQAAAVKFMRLMANATAEQYPNPLDDWFKKHLGVEMVEGKDLSQFTREMLRKTYQELQSAGV